MQLQLSTSPRSTWVWSAAGPDSDAIRALLGGRVIDIPQAGVFDVEIGVEALDALTVLRDAGYTFRWHSSQHVLNQTPEKFGIPVDPSH